MGADALPHEDIVVWKRIKTFYPDMRKSHNMERVKYISATGSEQLRPTHAILVAENMKSSIEAEETVEPAALAQACNAVRDTYKCRTVRKELRRVILLAQEATANDEAIQIKWPVTAND